MGRKKPTMESTACSQPNLAVHFPDYLDGELSPNETKEIEQHLAICAICRRKLRVWLSLCEEGLSPSRPQAGSK
jgi:anti-sigma factor RsiW